MALAGVNLGTMTTGKPRVSLSYGRQIYSSDYNSAISVSTPNDAASICGETTNTNLAHIMYKLKVQ